MLNSLFAPSKKTALLFLVFLSLYANSQVLKSVVYDFDGLNQGETDLPEGDYSFGDLSYKISPDPLAPADMLGDRVLELHINWQTGSGIFGRGISRYIEFDAARDRFNFYFYNPPSNQQVANLDICLTDDDDQSDTYDYFKDDCWLKSLAVPPGHGWQLFPVPLKDFIDSNAGGNGLLDMAFTGNQGMLLMVELRFKKTDPNAGDPVFYLDMLSFSDGNLPTGNTLVDLPAKEPSDHCLLGAYMKEDRGKEYLIPTDFEDLFPSGPGKRIRYVNFFIDWAMDGGTHANELPGTEIQTLLLNGYQPIITWEPLFMGYDRLDPVQPRLSNILNGNYNDYIDDFAAKIKTYNDTLIIRFMHEFEGDWYAWSISQNNHDPQQYIAAYRLVVDRFRALGVTKVKWMWCVNSDYAPYTWYNWIVPAYPGDNYVDIIGTDIYNNHYPVNSPYWKSFRMQAAESYYYLTRYFGHKPLYICELGCRERLGWEDPSSQSKGAWYERMDKELQSNFHKARALVFFNAAPDQNWLVNSSPYALQSLTDNVWQDDYYFKTGIGIQTTDKAGMVFYVYPNPSDGAVMISCNAAEAGQLFDLRVSNSLGQTIYSEKTCKMAGCKKIDLNNYGKGIYFIELKRENSDYKQSLHVTRKLIVQ